MGRLRAPEDSEPQIQVEEIGRITQQRVVAKLSYWATLCSLEFKL
jgi:hypothetical protein